MTEPLRGVAPDSVLTGWDFSTGGVKCLAFDLDGNTLAEVRLPTDLWTADGVSELNLMQLEGQAYASTRGIVARLRDLSRLDHWVAGGVSATHHTAGRIDRDRLQVRRAICWNDHTLGRYNQAGIDRLGGPDRVRELIGGPWAIRYSLSHLVKDEETLSEADWQRTWRMLPHGSLAAGTLTGNFDTASVSSAASTGIMDLRTGTWRREMLAALARPEYRDLAWNSLPRIVDQYDPVGALSAAVCADAGLDPARAPLVFPTSDDQQAGLAGGGAVEDGQVAVILGNSAVVNSSSARVPASGNLDVMRLNWGPYLWMRCYNNGAQFLDPIVGSRPDWAALEAAARGTPAGCDGAAVLPFLYPEPSVGVRQAAQRWFPAEPTAPGVRFRAALEALAYLIALGVREHERAGQRVTQVSVSGGIARSDLMCEVLATVLDRPLKRLVSFEGPALGAAATALAALESQRRKRQGIAEPYTVADAVARMVRFRDAVAPNPAWRDAYRQGLELFERRLRDLSA
ncbi:MAG: FGGY-family carbohydrate kinase [Gemmataceae bacterium]